MGSRTVASLLFCFFVLGMTQTREMGPDVRSLVETERAFADSAETQGIRDAFLAYLADDAVIFRPHPVAARQWYTDRPGPPGLLSWQPRYAEVSRAGDLGYTLGPWQFRAKGRSDPAVVHGHYVSVWQKQPDSSWRLVVDIGTTNPAPRKETGDIRYRTAKGPMRKSLADEEVEAQRLALLRTDLAFSEASRERGSIAAYTSFAADNIRILRENVFPAVGQAAITTVPSDTAGFLSWEPVAARVSRSADLGYTYGTSSFSKGGAAGQPADSSSYMRVWRRERQVGWKVAIDVAIPIPPTDTGPEN